jgi:pilus assembly protein CpaB
MNRRTRTLVVVGVAVVLASLASYGVLRALQSIPVREVPIAETFIVVATRPGQVGQALAPDQVRLAAWPTDAPVAGSFTSVDEVIGRGLLAPVVENEPITASKLADPEAGIGLPPTIPVGMRAQTVRVNDVIGVAGFVFPGSRVDVIVTARTGDQPSSRIVLKNLVVLAANTRYELEQQTGEAIPSSSVTLAVTPAEAEKLTLAQNQGQINLVLRNPLDTEDIDTAGVRLPSLLGEPTPPPVRRQVGNVIRVTPPPPPPKPYTIETIKGTERTEVPVTTGRGGRGGGGGGDRDEVIR